MWCYTGVMPVIRAVIDTNVIFEGLTRQGGACGLIVEGWLAGLFAPCVSDAVAYEYVDVLSRKLSERNWRRIRPVVGHMLGLAEFITVRYSWRPNSPDPADEHVIDCAMNANASVVTTNIRDFRLAAQSLGLYVMEPAAFIRVITQEEQD
jgi:predicted nucleic acid-binding protein